MSHASICRVLRLCVYFQLLFLVVVSAQAKRHDLVIMKNGDHLTGEVKKLENGTLYVDLDYVSGSVGLDWRQIDKVQSTATYQVVLNNGNHVAGNIEKTPAAEAPGKDFEITNAASVVRSAGSDVAQIESQKRNFWHQLKGSIDFGYDFTSGNSQTSLSSDANASYLATNWEAGTSFTSSFSGQSGASKTNLLELQLTAARFLNKNSFLLGLGDFLHSSQQDLNLRTTIGGGYGRYWIRTNKSQFRWITGAIGPFLRSNLYDLAAKTVTTGYVIGRVKIYDQDVHQLAFTAPDADFQLWVTGGENPRFVRAEIVNKKLEGKPRTTIQFLG